MLGTCAYGPTLAGGGGGTVWFARTVKLNINIFPQNCWRGGGGGHQKIFPDIPRAVTKNRITKVETPKPKPIVTGGTVPQRLMRVGNHATLVSCS